MYMYECIYRIHVCVNVCVCVCARGGVVCPSVRVRLYRRSCIEACMDAVMHIHTHIGGRICVCLQPSRRACAYVWIYMHACIDGSASTGGHRYACISIHTYIYIYKYIYIPIIHLLCTYMHASCMDPLCTQVSMSVCTQTDRYRWGARVFTRHPFSRVYNVHGWTSVYI